MLLYPLTVTRARSSFLLTKIHSWFAQWGCWQGGVDILQTAMTICADKRGLIYASLLRWMAEMEMYRGRCEEAYTNVMESHDVLQHLQASSSAAGPTSTLRLRIAVHHLTYGNVLFQRHDDVSSWVKAMSEYSKCIRNLRSTDAGYRYTLFAAHLNLSMAYRHLCDFDLAIKHATESRSILIELNEPTDYQNAM